MGKEKVWIYARAMDEQALQLQVDGLHKYAEDQGWEIAGENRELGVPLSNKRFGLLDTKEAIRSGRNGATCVLVWNLRKLERDMARQIDIIREIEQMGGKIFSCQEGPIDSSIMSIAATNAFLMEKFAQKNK